MSDGVNLGPGYIFIARFVDLFAQITTLFSLQALLFAP